MKIKLAILDIDGVLTDGRKYYGLDGIPFAKTYCDKDFTAIKRMRGAGVKVCFYLEMKELIWQWQTIET